MLMVVVGVDGVLVWGVEVYVCFCGVVCVIVICIILCEGICIVEVAPLCVGPVMVVVEVEVVVLCDGSVVWLVMFILMCEFEVVFVVIEGTGFGSSSNVWIINFVLFFGWCGVVIIYFVYGLCLSLCMMICV